MGETRLITNILWTKYNKWKQHSVLDKDIHIDAETDEDILSADIREQLALNTSDFFNVDI